MKAIMAVLGAMALAIGAIAGEITVTGNGRVRLPPDKMTITFSVSAVDKDIAQAKRLFVEKTATLAATLAKVGVESGEISTDGMSVSPEFDYGNGKREFCGYKFSEQYKFAAKVDRERLGRISTALFDCKAVEDFNSLFELFDRETPRREARRLAVRDALTMAEDIAEAAGVQLCEIEEIDNGASYAGDFAPTAVKSVRTVYADDEWSSASASLGDISISASVRIKWKIK